MVLSASEVPLRDITSTFYFDKVDFFEFWPRFESIWITVHHGPFPKTPHSRWCEAAKLPTCFEGTYWWRFGAFFRCCWSHSYERDKTQFLIFRFRWGPKWASILNAHLRRVKPAQPLVARPGYRFVFFCFFYQRQSQSHKICYL